MSRRAVIAGIGESDAPVAPHLSDEGHHAQACARALADAGLSRGDVDGYATPSVTTVSMGAVRLAEYLGIQPAWLDGTNIGGASFELLVQHAVRAIEAGDAETVLITYGEASKSGGKAIGTRLRVDSLEARSHDQWTLPFGNTLVGAYALAARRHMAIYGTTAEQLAAIAVTTRANAASNPQAMYREPITVADVLGSPMIADPLHLLDCCVISDGGGAIVLTTEERARDLRQRPVFIVGAASAATHVNIAWMPDLTTTAAAVSGPRAFAAAGVRPDEVDLAMIYDSFTVTALLQFEDLGFCTKGEGGPYAQETSLRYNVDGGALSAKHPGMRGIFLLTECVRQIRAGSARLAVASGMGGELSANGTVILAAEPTRAAA
jgi:acetyl-CoA acetyltransferase